ncbi:MAG: hypothetical protein KC455_02165 [Carnobacterium sp.]|nr:hypothetical protein [Carnobacterium sp.]
MLNLFSNPVFVPLLLVSTGIGLWWLLTSLAVNEKKETLNRFVDKVVYFLVIAFVGNGFVHFFEIIALPYRALILSTTAISASFLLVLAYSSYRFLKKEKIEQKIVVAIFQLVSLLGIINHIYYYFLYKSPLMVGLILLFSGLLLLSSTIPLGGDSWIIAGGLLGTIFHLLITRSQSVLYFGFVVTPELLGFIAIEWIVVLVLLLRRQKQSKRT